MYFRNRKIVIRIVSIFLIVALLTPVQSFATPNMGVTPRASYYLDSYNTYLYRESFGKIQVWFTVTGVDYMDEIGTLSIRIYESTDQETWTWVKTYTNQDTPSMLGNNKIYYSGHVDYQGTIGRYYKAYVCIWAGKDGDGDTRYMWTDIKKATLLPG